MNEHYPILIVLLPLFGSIIACLGFYRWPAMARGVVLLTLGLTLLVSILTFSRVITLGEWRYDLGGWAPPWGIEYLVDMLSGSMAVLISAIAILVAIYARPSMHVAFSSLYLLLVSGLLGMVLTGDLFNLYVFLEISALSAYALLASGGDRATVAVFRYLLVGTIGASFYLLGLGYLYAATGTLNMTDMGMRLAHDPSSVTVTVGLVLMIVGLAIKTAVFPLHGWLPDVYTYAPASVTGFVSAVMTKVTAYAIFRILYSIFQAQGAADPVISYLGIFGATGIIAASLMALAQKDVRRMLAYSSIAQLGYIILGFSIGTSLAIIGALFHVFNHAVMKGCLFLIAGGVQWKEKVVQISDYAGLSRRMPWTAAAFVLAALSMIGLPPMGGFFSKWYLVRGAIETGSWFYVGVMLAGSLITAAYFFRVIEAMYLRKVGSVAKRHELPATMLSPVLLLAIAVLMLGIFNQVAVQHILPTGFQTWGF